MSVASWCSSVVAQVANWRSQLNKLRYKKNRLTSSHFSFIITFNTGKEVIQKYMSSNHSEVAET